MYRTDSPEGDAARHFAALDRAERYFESRTDELVRLLESDRVAVERITAGPWAEFPGTSERLTADFAAWIVADEESTWLVDCLLRGEGSAVRVKYAQARANHEIEGWPA